MSNRGSKSICSSCGSKQKIEKHHVFPKCHFGHRNNNMTIPICRECHIELERFILEAEGSTHHSERVRRDKSFYVWCVLNFWGEH